VKAVRAVADVAGRAACEELVELTVRELGSIDILINNAGIIRRSPAADYSAEDWAQVMEINLNAVFRLSQLAGRRMLAQGSGKIVNIASLLSFQGGVFVPAYAASKGAVAQLTKALANEWAPKGVNVNAIAPGYMETNNTRALRADPVRSRRSWNAFPPAGGARPKIWPRRRSFWRPRPATTCTATSWWWMAGGWQIRYGRWPLQSNRKRSAATTWWRWARSCCDSTRATAACTPPAPSMSTKAAANTTWRAG
jgi:NAD(P)-dependent dehydrogenase (short-subunit alcohol dehydrogenase family)